MEVCALMVADMSVGWKHDIFTDAAEAVADKQSRTSCCRRCDMCVGVVKEECVIKAS